ARRRCRSSCGEHAADLTDPIETRSRTDQPPQQPCPTDDLDHVARLLPDQAADRNRVVDVEVEIDDEIPEENSRPPRKPPEVESCHAETDGRPDRRDRAGVTQRLTELGCDVVRRSEPDDTLDVRRGDPWRSAYPRGLGMGTQGRLPPSDVHS